MDKREGDEIRSLSLDPCNLCPRECGARRGAVALHGVNGDDAPGQRGACGADGQLRIARAALHFWEEPPISGEAGSGTVFFSGCPLHCVYCQNASIAVGGEGPSVSVERLAQICVELQEQGALNVNFVTPTHYTLHIIEAVRRARELGLSVPIVWNTSGYERVPVVRALEGTVDVYLADFKYADAKLAQRYSHAPDYPEVALAAIRTMVEQVGDPQGSEDERGRMCMTRGVIVRHLLLPGALDQSKRAIELLYSQFGDEVLYSIMNQYTPVLTGRALERFPELGASVPSEEYEELLDFVDGLGLEDYFWQDGPADAASFIPSWNGEGVLPG